MKTAFGPLYRLLGALGACCIAGVLLAQLYNIAGRNAAAMTGGLIGNFQLDGGDAYAGYLLAAGSFLTLAAALRRGDHIRVTLILNRLGGRARVGVEFFCLVAAVFLSGYFAFYAARLVWGSYTYHDISQNIDATPLWIPQLSMAIGIAGLFLAFCEELWYVIRHRRVPPIESSELARTE